VQWLNVSIFKAIGHAGVYYGFKLGHTIPWYSGFPFNFVSHPQYVGSVLSVVGAAVLVSVPPPRL
jgi:methylene-fatty-acyl-phospholipid synthase